MMQLWRFRLFLVSCSIRSSMNLVHIQNDQLSVGINTTGAELTSVKQVKDGFEFMWQADADIWPRTAPVLFPVVGKLKNDALRVNGNGYPLPQHGFARDKKFVVTEQSDTKVQLTLTYDDDTLNKYPYDFKLVLTYELQGNELVCGYEVINIDAISMYFSIGAHPGFNLPSDRMSDYHISFNKEETTERYLITDGLLDGRTEPLLQASKQLPLDVSLFDKDAIVMKHLHSDEIALVSNDGRFSVGVKAREFPYYGIWAKKHVQRFICLEPWCGHADETEGHTDISKKPGINTLEPGHHFNRSYTLVFHYDPL